MRKRPTDFSVLARYLAEEVRKDSRRAEARIRFGVKPAPWFSHNAEIIFYAVAILSMAAGVAVIAFSR